VVAHEAKTLGGGLGELRQLLEREGIDADWHQIRKSKQAAKAVERAVEHGADLVLAWGGDGTVQRALHALAGQGATLGILPAGTANLLATNLGIPKELEPALRIALHGEERKLDVGRMNGERFGVMAGIGFDAEMIRDADRHLKDRFGRLAYVWTGARHLGAEPVKLEIRVDGSRWFKGKASCVLFGNVGQVFGGLQLFEDASPADGRLDVGVVTARGAVQWSRLLGRVVTKRTKKSKLVRTTTGVRFEVRLRHKLPYELDGGDRPATKRHRVKLEPLAVTVSVPPDACP
jgi:YegS/Rv2252/BmrU family lipid kinase